MRIYEFTNCVELNEAGFKDVLKKAALGSAMAAGLGYGAATLPHADVKPAAVPTVDKAVQHVVKDKKSKPTAQIGKGFPNALVGLDKADATTRANTFSKVFVPFVKSENAKIAAERKQLLAAVDHYKTTKQLTPKAKAIITGLMKKYKTNDVEELIKRVDVIPTSLAVAQAALESGWGQYELTRQGNVFFGQKTWNKTGGVEGPYGERYASFDSPAGSIKSYLHNLNTHPAYGPLRDQRHALHKEGKSVKGLDLVPALQKYSTLGDEYINRVSSIIKSRLHNLDT